MISLPKWAQPPVRYQICAVRRPGADTGGAAAFIKAGHRQGRARRAEGLRLRAAAAQVMPRGAFTALLALCTGITLAFLAIPIVALFTQVPLGDVPGLLARAGGARRARGHRCARTSSPTR